MTNSSSEPQTKLGITVRPEMQIATFLDAEIDQLFRDKKIRQERARKIQFLRSLIMSAFFMRRLHRFPLLSSALYRLHDADWSRSSIRLDAMSISARELEDGLGRNNYKDLLAPYFLFPEYGEGYIPPTDQSLNLTFDVDREEWVQEGVNIQTTKRSGVTKPYVLRKEITSRLAKEYKNEANGRPTNAITGEILTAQMLPHNGIVQSSYSEAFVPSLIKFDLGKVDAIIADFEQGIGINRGRLRALRQLYEVRQWVVHLGGIPNLYTDEPLDICEEAQDSTEEDDEETTEDDDQFMDDKDTNYLSDGLGRLYGVGSSHLQRLKREARNALYAGTGWYDYDFERCHLTIISEICRGLNIEFDVLENYLSNRSEVENGLAEEIGVPSTKIKEVMNALAYGRSLANNPENSLVKKIGREATKKLQENLYYIWLYERMKEVRKEIVKRYTTKGEYIMNAVGKKKYLKEYNERGKLRKIKESRLLAHITQGIEALALNAIVREEGDILVLMQDGFVSREKKKEEIMEKRVRQETKKEIGYEIRLRLKGERM